MLIREALGVFSCVGKSVKFIQKDSIASTNFTVLSRLWALHVFHWHAS